jgi:hypothetical protein
MPEPLLANHAWNAAKDGLHSVIAAHLPNAVYS